MCGICGEFHFQPQRELNIPVLGSMVAMMARRGPDDQGVWADGERCFLGFRRLSVLDLSMAGHQPMVSQDGRYVIVYNGEVYNFRELRQQLEGQGYRFKSLCDSEVVLYALAHWDTKAFDYFNGMYALGFYDTQEKRLLLARDHAGIKPLYYLIAPEGVFFASQYDQILAHPWSHNQSVSSPGLGLYLRLGYIPAPWAILEHTHMVEPGTWLEVTADGRTKKGRFFTFPMYCESDLQGEEAYEAFDAVITAAVKRHTVSDVPVGAFLSGGIDSPLVTAKMKFLSNGTFKAFTIGTDDDRFNEAPDAIVYGRQIGVDHVVEQLTAKTALDIFDEVISACGEPFADYSIFPTFLLAKLASSHVKVMLSGDGGDELFWGYASRFASVLQCAESYKQPLWWRHLRRGFKKFLNLGNGHNNLRWASIGDWYRLKHTRLFEDWLQRLFPDLPPWPEDYDTFRYHGWDKNQTAQWLRWNEFTGHLTMVLLKVDRASMYHSLEVRVPFLDREVIDVAARINWRSCLLIDKAAIGKVPLRYSLARHVSFQKQDKRGFTVPMDTWLRGPFYPKMQDHLLQRTELLGLRLDQKTLHEMIAVHDSHQIDFGWGLWVLLSLANWEEKHLKMNHTF